MAAPILGAATLFNAGTAAELVTGLARFGVEALADDTRVNVTVRSSFITEIIFDPPSKIMTVVMQSGKTYEYPGTTMAVFQAFATSPSPGSYYNDHVKLKNGGGSSAAPSIVRGTSNIFRGASNIFGRG